MQNPTPNDASVIAQSQSEDWESAVGDLIAHRIAHGECFSSGEIAATLRTHRLDLRFSVTSLGEYIRDLFYGYAFPEYKDIDGLGTPGYPSQVGRYTKGTGRTPAGVLVFVYGPNDQAALDHDFEVDIPQPGNAFSRDLAQSGGHGPRPPAKNPVAYVTRGRCYIPRKVIDSLLGLTGRVIHQGDEVHVTLTNTYAQVTLDPLPTSQPYSLWKGSGRVAFYGNGTATFNEGDHFPVSVDRDGIHIDLANPLD